MLTVVSPAKSLDFTTKTKTKKYFIESDAALFGLAKNRKRFQKTKKKKLSLKLLFKILKF